MIFSRVCIYSFVITTLITTFALAQKDCGKFLAKADLCVSKILIITNSELEKFESKESLVKNYCE